MFVAPKVVGDCAISQLRLNEFIGRHELSDSTLDSAFIGVSRKTRIDGLKKKIESVVPAIMLEQGMFNFILDADCSQN